MSYDSKCYTLAAAFLADELPTDHPRFAEMADSLARQIQDTIESFMQYDEIYQMVPKEKS